MPVGFEQVFVFFCNFNRTSDTSPSIFCYYSVAVSLISINYKRFEVQCLGYALAKFQLLMISGLLCRCDNILVSCL